MIENLNLFFKDFSSKAVSGLTTFKILLDDKDAFIPGDVQRFKDYDVSGSCITKEIINIKTGDTVTITDEDGDNVNYIVLEKERTDSKLTKLYLDPVR